MVRGPDKKTEHAVHSVRNLTDSTYVLRLERGDFKFKAGQFCNVKIKDGDTSREYSMYGGELDPYIELLIKEVKDGDFSPLLKRLKPGQMVSLDEPYDENFTLALPVSPQQKYLFIASGTGIAPFHSYVRTYKNLDYQIWHGIRQANETYDQQDYAADRYVSCVSQGDGGNFKGRVTDYLKTQAVAADTKVYLCGNANMVFEVVDILRSRGFNDENIYTELFF